MKEVELLSPAGDFDCLKAAVQNGADCIYFGADSFNARASAHNFDASTRASIWYSYIRTASTIEKNRLVNTSNINAIKIAMLPLLSCLIKTLQPDLGLI